MFSGSCTGLSIQMGLIMEFVERGSLAALQDRLSGTPPWPLSFCLAHQVALGMDFLHRLHPPLLHLDLKPSNVLLDDSLHAMLTDFGLARVYHSFSKATMKDTGNEGGTLSYMPPVAFDILTGYLEHIKPTFASDCSKLALDDMVNLYNSTLSKTLNILAPEKTCEVTFQRSSPWFTDELRRMKTHGSSSEQCNRVSDFFMTKMDTIRTNITASKTTCT
ncbi:receptor-interacting serine/threonine-protein kinase 3-like [Coregonus clupeaformis]|uniref:receptor-interacting serine/threonine-protein kinase 3-like n=1 Tax=Coregonus clupeaformis TaxID=59861 RepID=UPI001E1C7875|nr:receptor-interacting serine/threonine-protein kinase 3-like [Coregonus clupeaformis]